MKNPAPAKRIAALVVTAAVLSACTMIEDFLAPLGPEPVAALPPPEERPRLEPISRNYFVLESADQSVIGEPQLVFTNADNTLSDLAREYGLGYDELIAANPDVDPWLPGDNTPVLLPTQYVLPDVPRTGIVLNIASKRLFYFPEAAEGESQKVMTYPIGIGRVGWETPLGQSAIVAKARDPSWYVPASVRREHEELGDPLPSIVPPGPDNPLGKFVLQLDMPGYLIHGTNQPYGVGMRVSHGCVRLYPENIELLYSLVGVGESVAIVNEPFLAGQHDGELYFEAHEPLEDDSIGSEDRLQMIFASDTYADVAMQDHARTVVSDGHGIPVRLRSADTAEVLERVRVVRNTVEPDPNMPTLAEVREMMDEPLEEEEAAEPVGSNE